MTVQFKRAVARYKKLPKEGQKPCLQAFLYYIAEQEKRVRFPKWAAKLDADWEETKRYTRDVLMELEQSRAAREKRPLRSLAEVLGIKQSRARAARSHQAR